MKPVTKSAQLITLGLIGFIVTLVGIVIFLIVRQGETMSDYIPSEKSSYECELRRAKDPNLIKTYYTNHYNNTDSISLFAAKDSDSVLSLATGSNPKKHSGNPYIPRGWITDSMSPLDVFTDDIDKEYSWNK